MNFKEFEEKACIHKLCHNGKHVGYETLILHGEPPNDEYSRFYFKPGLNPYENAETSDIEISHNQRYPFTGHCDENGEMIFLGDSVRLIKKSTEEIIKGEIISITNGTVCRKEKANYFGEITTSVVVLGKTYYPPHHNDGYAKEKEHETETNLANFMKGPLEDEGGKHEIYLIDEKE